MKRIFNFLPAIMALSVLSACDQVAKPETGLYRCGDDQSLTVLADFDKENPSLSVMGTPIEMTPVKQTGAIKYTYENEYGHTTIFEKIGDKTSLIIDRGDPESNFLGDCTLVVPDTEKDLENFKAIGHEPEWTVVFDKAQFYFHMLGRPGAIQLGQGDFDIPKMSDDNAVIINPSKDLRVIIKQEFCEDGMSGQAHLYSVQIEYRGETYNGCGFNNTDPMQELMGI